MENNVPITFTPISTWVGEDFRAGLRGCEILHDESIAANTESRGVRVRNTFASLHVESSLALLLYESHPTSQTNISLIKLLVEERVRFEAYIY